MKPEIDSERWHLSKAVPVTLLVGMLGQLVVGAWIARGVVAEIHSTQEEVANNTRRISTLETARSSERVSERLAVVESQVNDTRSATLRIEQDVRKLVERRQ